MRFGEPILESSISLIQDNRLFYRGRDAAALAETHSFEEVASLLWTGEMGGGRWAPAASDAGLDAGLIRSLARSGPPIERAMAGLGAVGLADAGRFAAPGGQASGTATRIVRAVVALMAPEARVEAALEAGTTAEALWIALSDGGGPADPAALGALDGALVLSADHELNASTFAARVAASTGANLYAVVVAALAALSGPRHGGASDRVEAMLGEVAREARDPREVDAAVAARLARGERMVEYGHPLYAQGDPRFVALRGLCDTVQFDAAAGAALARIDAVNDAARRLGYGEPTLDVGLVSLRTALGLPVGSAAAIFAAGRTAGWIAHALEQAATGDLLRPRARYVGPPPR
jgi:citrate synthase